MEPLEEVETPVQKITPRSTQKSTIPFLPNRAQRRAKIKADRVKAMKELRHAKKHDPAVLRRVMLNREHRCPTCHLDFLGSSNRCQCKVQKPAKSKVVA
jgi:hypothetical protein